MRVLGVDPGLIGGAAVLDIVAPFHPPSLVDAIDLPIGSHKASRRIDVAVIYRWIKKHNPKIGFIERAGLIPGQNVAAGAIFMRACGALEATVVLAGVPLHIVEAQSWKRRFDLPGSIAAGSVTVAKELARQKAISVFGEDRLLEKKSHHGRAEAALIAIYGVERNVAGDVLPTDGELPLHSRRPAVAV